MSCESLSKIVFKIDSMCCESNKQVDSLPCLISYTGPASVNSYFLSETINTLNNEEHYNTHTATFRGRILFGCKPLLPKNYKFYVAKRLRRNGKLFNFII